MSARVDAPTLDEEQFLAEERPDLVHRGRRRLSFVERTIIRFVRSTFEPGLFDKLLRFLQFTFGQFWIYHCTKHLLHVHGVERLPPLGDGRSILVVSNHRSFFDMYVITMQLVRNERMRKRIIFPVRSSFFYDSLLGLFVNGIMSFFAMYPPIFRDRSKAGLNAVSLSELGYLLKRGGMFAGLHPEGTRKRDDDPYTFLPTQPGVGRVIHEAQERVTIVPVFINGLLNDLGRQVLSNFTRRGKPIHVVFGEPIDFTAECRQKGSPRLYRAIAERCMQSVAELSEEERALRSRS